MSTTQYWDGYHWAAGVLLSKTKSEDEVEAYVSGITHDFDAGARAALAAWRQLQSGLEKKS